MAGMIQNRKELSFFIKADRMMNRGVFTFSFKDRINHIIAPDYIMKYLESMRRYSFYASRCGLIDKIRGGYNALIFRNIGLKLGFSIGKDVFDYGLLVPHYGTIVIGQTTKIGRYAMIQPTSTIDNQGGKMGDNFWLCTGAKIIGSVTLGDNVIVGANSFLNKSYVENNIVLGGIPAKIVSHRGAWWETHQDIKERIDAIEKLKVEMGL